MKIVDVRASLQSDKSFTSYAEALAHVRGPRLTNDVQVYWNQVMLDVLFEYPIHSERSRFSIHPGLARLGLQVITAVRFLPPGGVVRAFEFVGDPGLLGALQVDVPEAGARQVDVDELGAPQLVGVIEAHDPQPTHGGSLGHGPARDPGDRHRQSHHRQ